MADITRSRRRWLLAASAGCAALLAGASFSWACTAQAGIQLFPKSGPAGTEVTVIGDAFAQGKTVEIRLDSPRGELLGTAEGPHFETMVVLPQMEPGEHTIIGMILDDGQSGGGAAVAFAPQQFLTTPGRVPVKEDPEGRPKKQNDGQQPAAADEGPAPARSEPNTVSAPDDVDNVDKGSQITFSGSKADPDTTAADLGRTNFPGPRPLGDSGQFPAGKSLFADAAPSLGFGAQEFGDDPLRAPFAIGVALMAFGSLALLAGAFMFLLLGKREARATQESSEL